jgi:hypothetical protein
MADRERWSDSLRDRQTDRQEKRSETSTYIKKKQARSINISQSKYHVSFQRYMHKDNRKPNAKWGTLTNNCNTKMPLESSGHTLVFVPSLLQLLCETRTKTVDFL